MRRFLKPPFALLAGLALVLTACSGESPTAPSAPPGGGQGGTCNVTITLASTSVTPLAGTAVIVRATVKRDGVAVADGTSVLFTTDLGFFLETGLPTISKVTVGGFADVTLASLSSGSARISAALECGRAALTVQFAPVPVEGPFVSTIFPERGTCAGGDTVTINGGKFGTDPAAVRVLFGGQPATIVSVSDNQIVVLTPERNLPNPQLVDVVDVVILIGTGAARDTVTVNRGFTYFCINPNERLIITSLTPTSGPPEGGTQVTIFGQNFKNNPATTRVTFCNVSGAVTSVTNNTITVLTPRHPLANPNVPETCDVGVTVDLGLVSQQSGVLPQAFTYRASGPGGGGGGGNCNTLPGLFITFLAPITGSPVGGTSVTISGGGFGNSVENTRVEFGGVPGTVTAVSPSSITVLTPRHTLANPNVSETVEVRVFVDVGGPNQACASVANGFTYRAFGPGADCNTFPGLFISSVSPSTGSPQGGDTVTINGGGFGADTANTRVEFGGVPGQVTNVTANQITVVTPRFTLTNPNVSQTVEIKVFRDVGGPLQACASLGNAFTFRAFGPGQQPCNTNPSVFISSIIPNTGSPNGGTAVTITGGGFGTDTVNTRVEFGGLPGQIVSVTNSTIVVAAPRRTLADPNVPEAVDVRVIVDVGGGSEVCASAAKGFVYTRVTLDPVIYSSSPRTGPNDASTRVTIFGDGFQFPMQVFVRGGTCSGNVEASVVTISVNEIVFLTPQAQNANACLAGGLVDIIILNPQTGKTATCEECFKYYTCPTVQGITPAVAPYNQTTTVIVTGNAFEEPVEATFNGTRLNVTSVSSSSIALQMPPIDPTTNCTNVTGTINLSFLNVSCPALTQPFEYLVPRVSVSNATPTQLNQDGTPFGSAGSVPATITVTGVNFEDLMTVSLTKNGGVVPDTTVIATVSSSGVLSFSAPPVRDESMNSVACSIGGLTIGNQYVPTSFGIQVRNARTGCTGTLNSILVYNPRDTTCRSAPVITTAQLPAAVMCSAFGPVTLTAVGGTEPYSWTATGLPSGLTLDLLTGVLSGTPQLAASGPGLAAQIVPVSVTVTDTTAQAKTRQYQLQLTDAGAPFQITGLSNQTIPSGGGASTAFTASPTTFGPINWSIVSVNPAAAGITLSSTTGTSVNLNVDAAVPAGSYVVTLRATDSACGPFDHTVTFAATLTKSP